MREVGVGGGKRKFESEGNREYKLEYLFPGTRRAKE